jgi:hypothetical protein
VKGVSADHHWGQRFELGKEVRIERLNGRSSLIAPEYTPDDTLEAQSRVDRIWVVLDAVSSRTREIYFAHPAGYSYGRDRGASSQCRALNAFWQLSSFHCACRSRRLLSSAPVS